MAYLGYMTGWLLWRALHGGCALCRANAAWWAYVMRAVYR
jgi:hypothetical protein